MKMIKIDKDSHGTIAKAWGIIAVLAALTILLIHNAWVYVPILLFLAAFAFFVFWFHRIPDREIGPGDDRTVTSVADGKVVIVEEAYEPEYFKGDCMQISIYMDFFDVHANFWPVDGQISYYRYHPGKYLLASSLRLRKRMNIPPLQYAIPMERYSSSRLPARLQGV